MTRKQIQNLLIEIIDKKQAARARVGRGGE